MILTLNYTASNPLPIRAALLRGNDPMLWLREMAGWNIPPANLVYLLMPASVASPAVSGLFVIFRDPSAAAKLNLLEPYGCTGEKLFIPCHAMIQPQVNKQEWKDILLWDWQVFHPAIGLVGFEKKDELDPGTFLAYTEPLVKDWSYAHPGNEPAPVLTAITVVPPTSEEMIGQVKKEIDQKPLDQIPKNKSLEPSAIEKMTDAVKRGILKTLAGMMGNKAGKTGTGEGTADAGGGNGGLMGRFQQWVQRNLEELEAKRRNELQRLLRLFDDDPDEALQYALPLNSPYMDRGTAQQSDRLSRNPVDFNLGRLGGGGRGDYWDVGNYYGTLRNKYLRAADKELFNKNYKKAAYIYAHLLGDYTAAANALEQGNMYREAAVLYRDHLKNLTAAAQCLERGGLTLEAIEIYKELEQFEKTGDLYNQLEQQEQARQYYQRSADSKLSKKDYMEAARITSEKMNEQGKARKILLDGWDDTAQHENCLIRYFEMGETESIEGREKEVKKIYQSHTPDTKKMALLNVLEQLRRKNDGNLLADTSNEIAYQIVHDEAEKGNIRVLQRLNGFLRNDKLIGSDTSRYVNTVKTAPLVTERVAVIKLDDTIRWIKACWHRNQFLAVGIKKEQLYMARGNWYGNLEYYTWEQTVKFGAPVELINAPYITNDIILFAGHDFVVTTKQLQRNKYFNDAVRVFCPSDIEQGRSLCAIKENGEYCLLSEMNGDITLHFYKMADGSLLRSIPMEFEEPGNGMGRLSGNLKLTYKDRYLYTASGQSITAFDMNGQAKWQNLSTGVRFYAASDHFASLSLVISTYSGCILCRPEGLNLNWRSDFFAVELIPSLIVFIQSTLFVLVQKNSLHLYSIKNELPKNIRQYETTSVVVAVFPGNDRQHFFALQEDGQMARFELEEE